MKNIYTSIEIGNDTIRILVSENFGGKLRTLAVSSVRSKGIKNSAITDEVLLTERIKLAIEDIKARISVKIKNLSKTKKKILIQELIKIRYLYYIFFFCIRIVIIK